MLGFSVLVTDRLVLVAPVTLDATLEVVVLTLAADPAPIRKVKIILRRQGGATA